jgi:putative restriction endonuclease
MQEVSDETLPAGGLHLSDRLLGQKDGPMLNGGTIHLPSRLKDRPDRDRLALRFERFKALV